MDINERIRYLRKDLKLSQKEFGEKIGLKHGAISRIEKSGNTVIDQNISLICSVFSIEEKWLRTGEGNIYKTNRPSSLDQAVNNNEPIHPKKLQMIQNFLSLPEEDQDILIKAISIIGKVDSK